MAARIEQDWPRADELKVRIEAAGWKVVDDGPAFDLHPLLSPDVIEDDRRLYGSVASVPSRLDEVPSAAASIIVVARSDGPSPSAAIDALRRHGAAGTQLVLVADRDVGPVSAVDELVLTAQPFSAGDALQAGVRRATGAIIVVLDPARIPTADVVGPLREALRAAAVAVAGSEGLDSTDLHRFVPADGDEPTTVTSGCYAFRRTDIVGRGPVDGRLRLDRSVAAWLGLLLREGVEGRRPRDAVLVQLPLDPAPPEEEQDPRAARRDRYRIAERFAGSELITEHP